MNNIFDRINSYIESAEGSIITFITTIVPWLAPALPAYLTYRHLNLDIQIPWLVAGAMAASVEMLGLAAIATAFSAMRNNKVQRANKNKVSLSFPIGAYVFYILVVLVVNVVLEWPMSPEQKQYAHIAAIALLTLISAPAFVIAISRQEQHQIEQDTSVGGATVSASAGANLVQKSSLVLPAPASKSSASNKYQQFVDDQSIMMDLMPWQQVKENYGVSRRSAFNYLDRYKKEYPERSNQWVHHNVDV